MAETMDTKKIIEAQIKLIEIAKGIEEGAEPEELLSMVAATLAIFSSNHTAENLG